MFSNLTIVHTDTDDYIINCVIYKHTLIYQLLKEVLVSSLYASDPCMSCHVSRALTQFLKWGLKF